MVIGFAELGFLILGFQIFRLEMKFILIEIFSLTH